MFVTSSGQSWNCSPRRSCVHLPSSLHEHARLLERLVSKREHCTCVLVRVVSGQNRFHQRAKNKHSLMWFIFTSALQPLLRCQISEVTTKQKKHTHTHQTCLSHVTKWKYFRNYPCSNRSSHASLTLSSHVTWQGIIHQTITLIFEKKKKTNYKVYPIALLERVLFWCMEGRSNRVCALRRVRVFSH